MYVLDQLCAKYVIRWRDNNTQHVFEFIGGV